MTFLGYLERKRDEREIRDKGHVSRLGKIPASTFKRNGIPPTKKLDEEFFTLRMDDGEPVQFSNTPDGIEAAWEFLQKAAEERDEELIAPIPAEVKSLSETMRDGAKEFWVTMKDEVIRPVKITFKIGREGKAEEFRRRFSTPSKQQNEELPTLDVPAPSASRPLSAIHEVDTRQEKPAKAGSSKWRKSRLASSGQDSTAHESVADSGVSIRQAKSRENTDKIVGKGKDREVAGPSRSLKEVSSYHSWRDPLFPAADW